MSGGAPKIYTVQEWMDMVEKGEVRVPEFQREFVWDQKKAVGLVEAILKERPVGSLLGLEVSPMEEDPPFQPRPIRNAPEPRDKCSLLILDGQQRLTALWHALKNTDPDYSYFLHYPEKSTGPAGHAARKPRNGRKTWINDEKMCIEKGFVPVHLLAYSLEDCEVVLKWVDQAYKDEEDNANIHQIEQLRKWIFRMSERMLYFKIPYLSLPDTTSKLEAIDTFVESNTSAQQLSKFDITVAVMRLRDKGDNLRKLRDETSEKISEVNRYVSEDDLGDLLIKIACLRQNLPPTQGNYERKEVLEEIENNIDAIRKGIKWTCKLLKDDYIFSSKFLPSRVPLRVLPALHGELPSDERRDICLKMVRRYLWRAFLTGRYTSDAAHLLLSDYRGLRDLFRGEKNGSSVPIWDEEVYRLPDASELINDYRWPRNQGTLPRAILAISLRKGARDLCHDEKIDENNIEEMEAHHIFPRQYLKDKIQIINESNTALNCMLIKARTNRRASSKPPIEYLRAIYSMARDGTEIGSKDIKARLESHLVPAELLLDEDTENVAEHYNRFLRARADRLLPLMEALARGENP